MKCDRAAPYPAKKGSPILHMMTMDVSKAGCEGAAARASPPLPSATATPVTASGQQPQVCAGCHKQITERYMLKALDLLWHEDCLKCGCCDCRLGEVGSSLFTRANLILCKRDYLRLFGNTGYCAACNKVIPAFEMVMRARNNVYHLECFACQQCNHRFCVGDRFYLCENKILCECDYEERLVFANMAYNPPPLPYLKRQTSHLQPAQPPVSNSLGALMNGGGVSGRPPGDLNNNMSGSGSSGFSPAPSPSHPHLKPLGLSTPS